MLIRNDDRGVLAIGQASHAWISGQLARAWGDARFGTVEPFEEVCLASEQHDVGMAEWDLEPAFNGDTGLPQSFLEMPIAEHLRLWRAGPRRLLTQSRYVALLVSMHGERLYRRRDLAKLPARDADDVRAYLGEQQRFQADLLDSLRGDPNTAPQTTAELVARNSQLIWIWDLISLVVCLGWAPHAAQQVPTAADPIDVEIREATLDPWPFRSDAITLRCDARRLNRPQPDAQALKAELASAPWETFAFELRRA